MQDLDRLGFGCVQLTSFANPNTAVRLLEQVLDLGIVHFDTAPVYGQGYSERIIGRFLKGRRGQVFVATKFGLPAAKRPRLAPEIAMPLNAIRRRVKRVPALVDAEQSVAPPPNLEPRITQADIDKEFAASCEALGVELIDLYLLHESLPIVLRDDAFERLIQLKKQGRIRQLGIAANGDHYKFLDPSSLAGWDVLQYEGGPSWPGHADLPARFPNQQHIFHSCFKHIPRHDGAAFATTLSACLAQNPRGKVIFASTKIEHVRRNLSGLET